VVYVSTSSAHRLRYRLLRDRSELSKPDRDEEMAKKLFIALLYYFRDTQASTGFIGFFIIEH